MKLALLFLAVATTLPAFTQDAQTGSSQPSREDTIKYLVTHLSQYDSNKQYETKSACGVDPYQISVVDGDRTIEVAVTHKRTCEAYVYDIAVVGINESKSVTFEGGDGPYGEIIIHCKGLYCIKSQDHRREPSIDKFTFSFYGEDEAGARITKALIHLIELLRTELNNRLDSNDPFAH